MHERVPARREEGIRLLWSRRLLFRIEAVGDQDGVDSEARAEVFHDRLSHGDDGIGRPQGMPLELLVEPALKRRRPRRARRLEGPPVTQLGDPGDAATPER
jgi:hypothetical protein